MKQPFRMPGISRFVFVALLLVFNWPMLSIPAPGNLLTWLFLAWGLAIALLFLAARGAAAGERGPEPPGPEPEGPGSGAQGGARGGPGSGDV